MTLNRCESASCCEHTMLTAVVMRDGVPHGLCLECGSDIPMPEMAGPAPIGAPCGDYTKSDIAHQWGGPL